MPRTTQPGCTQHPIVACASLMSVLSIGVASTIQRLVTSDTREPHMSTMSIVEVALPRGQALNHPRDSPRLEHHSPTRTVVVAVQPSPGHFRLQGTNVLNDQRLCTHVSIPAIGHVLHEGLEEPVRHFTFNPLPVHPSAAIPHLQCAIDHTLLTHTDDSGVTLDRLPRRKVVLWGRNRGVGHGLNLKRLITHYRPPRSRTCRPCNQR